MERIKGILAAGALTSVLLATTVGFSMKSLNSNQPDSSSEKNPVIIIEQTATPMAVFLSQPSEIWGSSEPSQPSQPQGQLTFQSGGGEYEDSEYEDSEDSEDKSQDSSDSEHSGGENGSESESEGGDD